MKNKYIILIVMFFVFGQIFSQKQDKMFNAEGENAIYKKEWAIGMRFHTNALSVFFEHVWIKDIKKRKLIQVGLFSSIDYRHKKTKSIIPRFIQDTRATKYHYGKQNDFISLQLMYGWRRVIANKSEVSGVKLALTYMLGVNLGVLKPYYLRIDNYNDSGIITNERYNEETAIVFLDKNKIVGESDFGKGFDKLSFTPGLSAKIGLNFDFARKNNFITSLEIGSQLDVFYKKLNIYINEENKPYILNLYLSMQFGVRN